MVERDLAKVEVAGSSPVIRSIFMAPWPSGKARVCKTLIPGPNPGGASKKAIPLPLGRGIAFFATRIRGRIAAKRRPGEMLLCPRWAKEHSKPPPEDRGARTPGAGRANIRRRRNSGSTGGASPSPTIDTPPRLCYTETNNERRWRDEKQKINVYPDWRFCSFIY